MLLVQFFFRNINYERNKNLKNNILILKTTLKVKTIIPQTIFLLLTANHSHSIKHINELHLLLAQTPDLELKEKY